MNGGVLDLKVFGWKAISPSKAIERADMVLEECDDICKELGFGGLWFLMGLCLGMIRDGGYIQNDTDLDIGIMCSEEELEKFKERLIENGYIRNGISQCWFKCGIVVDLFHIASEDASFYKSFANFTYKDRVYRIPNPIEEYLQNNYGDWRVKKPKNPTNDYGQLKG